MNERIKELKDQCWVEKCIPHWDNGMWIEKHIDLEKFAELIVGECASVCENSNYEFGTIFTKMIKEHFGVEE